ncbi:MAG: ParB/RepB/Spo0J family partition protein [Phycisphaeraceae bacterium]
MSKAKKPRLGRGLSSLMSIPVAVNPPVEVASGKIAPTQVTSPDVTSPDVAASSGLSEHREAPAGSLKTAERMAEAGGLIYLAIDAIRANPHQPRQAFDPEALQRLAESIRQDGLMQPIVVRPRKEDPRKLDGATARYEIVAGERRWRAGQLAGLSQLPAIVRDLSDQQMAEWALIENLQREDLNPMERAEAFRGLIDQFGLTHEQVADRVGIERSTISNTLRLLDLHNDIQQMLRHNQLSAGHAKALLGLVDPMSQLGMARRAMAGGWSVRMVEAAVKRVTGGGDSGGAPGSGAELSRKLPGGRSAHIADLEQQIAAQLKTKVHIKSGRRKGSGTLSIDFYNLDQFDELLGKLGVRID